MKIQFVVITLILLTSCATRDKEKPQSVRLDELRMNDIIHDSLTEKQLSDIAKIQRVFYEVDSISREDAITNFKRDLDPDSEIAIWLKMAEAYQRFVTAEGRSIGYDKKKEVYRLVLLRSMMADTEATDQAGILHLSPEEVSEVLGYFDMQPESLKIMEK